MHQTLSNNGFHINMNEGNQQHHPYCKCQYIDRKMNKNFRRYGKLFFITNGDINFRKKSSAFVYSIWKKKGRNPIQDSLWLLIGVIINWLLPIWKKGIQIALQMRSSGHCRQLRSNSYIRSIIHTKCPEFVTEWYITVNMNVPGILFKVVIHFAHDHQ